LISIIGIEQEIDTIFDIGFSVRSLLRTVGHAITIPLLFLYFSEIPSAVLNVLPPYVAHPDCVHHGLPSSRICQIPRRRPNDDIRLGLHSAARNHALSDDRRDKLHGPYPRITMIPACNESP